MRVLELFSGTGSVGKVCREMGWEVVSLDICNKHNPSICIDFMNWDYTQLQHIDIIWASPDCRCYSMASGNKHWGADRQPKTEQAKLSLKLLMRLKDCIRHHETKNHDLVWFIENPRARMRWFNDDMPRHTVCYCKYGCNRMKPTDIWTNRGGFVPRMCKNNNPDCGHERAPRGSNCGTQGMSLATKYSIPPQLIKELLIGARAARDAEPTRQATKKRKRKYPCVTGNCHATRAAVKSDI